MKKIALITFASFWIIMSIAVAYYPRESMAYIDSLCWERTITLKNLNTNSEPRKVTASGENDSPYWPTYELESGEGVYDTEQTYTAYVSIDGNRPIAIELSQTKWESLYKDSLIPARELISRYA